VVWGLLCNLSKSLQSICYATGQLRPVTKTSWVVSYGGKTIPRWRTAAILKIDTSPYFSEKSSDSDAILYTAADFEIFPKINAFNQYYLRKQELVYDVVVVRFNECHVIKNEKVAFDRPEFDRTYYLMC